MSFVDIVHRAVHPVSHFFSELGILLLMFFVGLEINLPLFRQKLFRSIVFGLTTTSIPLLLDTVEDAAMHRWFEQRLAAKLWPPMPDAVEGDATLPVATATASRRHRAVSRKKRGPVDR
jgi:hypothetical protein